MAAAREKQRTHRDKKLAKLKAKTYPSMALVEPMEVDNASEKKKIVQKVKVSTKSRSALIPSEGRSMGMDLD